MRKIVVLVLAVLCAAASGAQEMALEKDDPVPVDLRAWTEENLPVLTLSPSVAATYDYGTGISTRETFEASYLAERFALTFMFSMNNDGKYTADIANTPSGDLWGNYLLMESGGIAFKEGNLRVRMGRLPQYDVIDTPYSLFVSSKGHAANTIEINYERGRFFYQSRYISLNANSSQITPAYDYDQNGNGSLDDGDFLMTWPDRGANFKVYGFKFGDMRVGIQDMAVYCGTAFDWEYLVNPNIGYLIQYVRGTEGRPFSTSSNDNYAIGAFWDWTRPDGWTLDAQFFLDDGNTHWLVPSYFPDIPFKISWTAGARKSTPVGRFGFHTAGATKYTYQATLTEIDNIYSFTYYPDVLYDASGDGSGDWTMIDYEDNYLGYKYGENNLALCAEYRHTIAGFGLGADLEFLIDGGKGPTNPWNELPQSPDAIGTHWLDDPVLQYKVLLTAKASRTFGNFTAFASLKLGYVWNKINVTSASNLSRVGLDPIVDGEEISVDENMSIYTPQDGINEAIIKITLGGRYSLPLR